VITATILILANFANFVLLIVLPVWHMSRLVYSLKTRKVSFMQGQTFDFSVPWQFGDDQAVQHTVCYIKLNATDYYQWNVNNDGSLCKYNTWGGRKWFNRQRVIFTRSLPKNHLGQRPVSRIKFINTRFFVAWAIERYTREQFVMAKIGGFKKYQRFNDS
jgi:hypothetical protein